MSGCDNVDEHIQSVTYTCTSICYASYIYQQVSWYIWSTSFN